MTENNDRVQWKKVMSKRSRGYKKGEERGEVGTLLLGNDKNNGIVNYLLCYFLC